MHVLDGSIDLQEFVSQDGFFVTRLVAPVFGNLDPDARVADGLVLEILFFDGSQERIAQQ
ncbi:MAG: hypothetical protein IIC63_07450, partial [Proteobacteria bacterium]|nr:hypothetical protein [Pseudomonadota bacterium]